MDCGANHALKNENGTDAVYTALLFPAFRTIKGAGFRFTTPLTHRRYKPREFSGAINANEVTKLPAPDADTGEHEFNDFILELF